MTSLVLTLNAGSSSIKFALYRSLQGGPVREAVGQVEGLTGTAVFSARRAGRADRAEAPLPAGAATHRMALAAILQWIEAAYPRAVIAAVGHRIVHGGSRHAAPVIIDDAVLAELKTLIPLAPLHQPHNLAGVHAAREAFPAAPQVACFDTAFHRGHPFVADAFALPRRFYDEGIRRYGFHGLSYEYVAGEHARLAPEEAAGRVVIAHLGNGASMCALRGGRSVASTMGFTALDGLPMGTRCGQLDPGVVIHLIEARSMTTREVQTLLYTESGLKGLSGLSGDMRDLLASDRPEAAEAIAYFVSRIRRELGGLAAALCGLDAVVFTAGIGENAPPIREAALADMEWLGIRLDAAANREGRDVISTSDSRVRVRVVRTDEEAMIARHTIRMVGG